MKWAVLVKGTNVHAGDWNHVEVKHKVSWKQQEFKENVTVLCFIRMCNPDWVIGNVDHAGVFDFVDRVATDVGHLSTLGDQHNVVPFKETNKPCQRRKNNKLQTLNLLQSSSQIKLSYEGTFYPLFHYSNDTALTTGANVQLYLQRWISVGVFVYHKSLHSNCSLLHN